MNKKQNVLPVVVAIVLVASLVMNCLPVYAENAGTSATVLNSAPSVDVELTPDDDLVTPGVQVINPEPTTMNKTVTIIANVTDMNGYDDLTGVVIASITGPSVVEDSPVSLSFDSVVNPTAAAYTGTFNMSNHLEGDYKVEVTATDFGGLTGVGSKDFTYLYAAPPDTIPPEVTNPGANPASIVANGMQESRLNVTVTDASGIYSVTVDLTEIGGLAAEPMEKIEGTEIYTTTTTASGGTSPGTYYLPVNATDNSPSRNSNTSVSIPLTVLPAEVVTTYDFTTGAGKDKWAFRKQHKEKPPAKNGDPNNGFKVKEYKKIKFNDSTMQADASAANGFYAIHRFKFSIVEPESSITKLNILWDGKATHDWGTDGATLYIWNFEAGMYEQLVTSNDADITLEGTITDNIGDYIDDDSSLIIIAEQNTAHWWLVLKHRSRIGTDYVMVNVFEVVE